MIKREKKRMNNYKNCIYVLTNPLYAGYVKIGYATDLNARLASLNTGMLQNFKVYCVYQTDIKNSDLEFHKIITDLVPILRAKVVNGQKIQDKEFFKFEPEQVYDLFSHIAKMTNTEDKLHKIKEEKQIESKVLKTQKKQKRLNFTLQQKSYQIGTITYKFKSWKESLTNHCEKIIETIGFEEFKSKVLNLKLSERKSKRKIFAEMEEEMRGFDFYKFTEGELYLLTNYSAECIKKINELLNDLFSDMKLTYKY